ncbi:hypothetical protein [Nocardiopsis salina]|uniref:hypothetical protein n=1 Tax=Nocardiopsis salina TaxID=245836 RepID=UPI000687063F|nr:hypothetical protein [Nocardiopsis salina]
MGEPHENEPYEGDPHTPGVPPQVAGGAEVGGESSGSALRNRTPQTDEEPDVLLDVPRLNVDEIELHVERLRARVALQARVSDVLDLHVGADVDLDGVELDIKGVEAEAQLKVRLGNVEAIIERVLRSIDENPEIVEATARTLPSAKDTEDIAGGIGQAAEGAGRAAAGTTEGAARAAEGVADTASGTADPGGDSDLGDAAALSDLGHTDVPDQGSEAGGSGDTDEAEGPERGAETEETGGPEQPEGPEAPGVSGAGGEPAAAEEQQELEGPGAPVEQAGPEGGGEPEGLGDSREPAGSEASEAPEGAGDTVEPAEEDEDDGHSDGGSHGESGDERWSRIRNEAKQLRRASRKRFLEGIGSGAKQVGREVGGAAARVVRAARNPD